MDELESAIANYEMAYRMQAAVPELIDVKGETRATRKLYGLDSKYDPTRTFGMQCLIARRLVEKGVRFIELTCPRISGNDRWDAHGGLKKNHGDNSRATDQPIAGLLRDLKSRGMLKDTLVVWSGEFGRTPFAQGSNGRDHNPFGFTIWMAGGGAKRHHLRCDGRVRLPGGGEQARYPRHARHDAASARDGSQDDILLRRAGHAPDRCPWSRGARPDRVVGDHVGMSIVIVAAGRGSRMGQANKLFMEVAGLPLVATRGGASTDLQDSRDRHRHRESVHFLKTAKHVGHPTVEGRSGRSVWNGVNAPTKRPPWQFGTALAVRTLLAWPSDRRRPEMGAAVLAKRVSDTLKRGDGTDSRDGGSRKPVGSADAAGVSRKSALARFAMRGWRSPTTPPRVRRRPSGKLIGDR